MVPPSRVQCALTVIDGSETVSFWVSHQEVGKQEPSCVCIGGARTHTMRLLIEIL
jgi:hypothetical protein